MNIKKWQYKTITIILNETNDFVDDILNSMGNEGWEIVNVILQKNAIYSNLIYTFKRCYYDE